MKDKKQQYEKPELIRHDNLNDVTKGTPPSPSPSSTPPPGSAPV